MKMLYKNHIYEFSKVLIETMHTNSAFIYVHLLQNLRFNLVLKKFI